MVPEDTEKRYLKKLLITLILVCLCFGVAFASPVREFVDISDAPGLGIEPYVAAGGMAAGLAASDCDDDGDIDLFVPNGEGVADQFYQNQGDGSFLEIAGQVGLASLGRNKLAIWLDADNDNLLDLLVAGDCADGETRTLDAACFETDSLTFYRQTASGQFVNETVAAGFSGDTMDVVHFHRGGMAAGDINNDGFLDVFMSVWKFPDVTNLSQIHRLYLNNGDGTFSNITANVQLTGSAGGGWQPMMADVNKDGFIDIYAAIDFHGNRLWMNGQNNTFVDQVPAAGADNAMSDMGVAFGDYDNDLDLDIYVTNIYLDFDPEDLEHNILLNNTSDSNGASISFNEVSHTAGCEQGYWGWGCTFMDMENNGLLDIAATNGYFDYWPIGFNHPSVFYRNTGNHPSTFQDASDDVGFNDTLWGSGLVAFDYNRDGWLDLAQATIGIQQVNKIRILENRLRVTADPNEPANNYLIIKPRMCSINRRAIGATVEVVAGNLTMMRLISAGCSLMGQEPAEAVFGLGQNAMADTVTIRWPSGGRVTQLTGVSANQVLTLHKPAPADFNGNLKVDLVDFHNLSSEWMQTGSGLQTDLTDDGVADILDLKQLCNYWLLNCP